MLLTCVSTQIPDMHTLAQTSESLHWLTEGTCHCHPSPVFCACVRHSVLGNKVAASQIIILLVLVRGQLLDGLKCCMQGFTLLLCLGEQEVIVQRASQPSAPIGYGMLSECFCRWQS